MNPATILTAVLVAAIAIGLAAVITRPREGTIGAFVVLALLFLFAGEFVGIRYLAPKIEQTVFAPKTLPDEPVFGALRKHEPAAYERLNAGYREAVRSGDVDAYIRTAYEEVAKIAIKRMGSASDEAVSAFTANAVVQLKELRNTPDDTCFRYMFPQVSGPPNFAALPRDMMRKNADSLAAVINTSAETPQAPPTEQEIMPSFKPLLEYLARTYGQDLRMLSNPAAPNVDRRKVCDISIDLYEHVMALPLRERSGVLRYMLAHS